MILDVIDEMRLLQPSSNIQLSKKNPTGSSSTRAGIIRKGWGQPSMFNADVVVQELLRQGKSVEDARVMAAAAAAWRRGRSARKATSSRAISTCPRCSRSRFTTASTRAPGKQIGLETGDAAKIRDRSMSSSSAYKRQLRSFHGNQGAGQQHHRAAVRADTCPSPFLSILIDDCIKKGKDYNAGGARYNTNYIQGVGLGSMTDSLAAIKYQRL